MGVPFILFIITVFLLSIWFYNSVLLTNPYFSFLFGKEAVDTTGPETFPVHREAEPGENAGEHFYVPEEFPIVQYGEQWATLDINSAEVSKSPVIFGDGNDILKRGIAHFTGSRFPGQMGNIVMSGHVTTPFSKLDKVKVGDLVQLHTKYGEYEYEVYETVIFKYTDETYVLPSDGTEKLTIYTCYPAGISFKSDRLAIICSKVSGKNWME